MSDNKKLYKLAPILSPSIYETIFFSQYQSRLDKDALILDEETFRQCYIADNSYRVFLESNSDILKRAYYYIGLQQLYDSVVTSIEFEKNNCILTLSFKHLKELASELIKENSFNFKPNNFFIKLIFQDIEDISINTLDSKENLKKVDVDLKDYIYLQDQITIIDKNFTQIVISLKHSSSKEKDNIKYMVVKCRNIEIEENAKMIWTSIFPENMHMLYDFFLNFRTKNSSCFDSSYKKIINQYEKFIELLDE